MSNEKDLNKRAIQTGLFYTICQLFVRGLSFLVTPFYTRILTEAQYGIVKIYESWLLILVPVVCLGIYRSVEVAKYDYDEEYDSYVGNMVVLGFILSFIWLIICLLFRNFIGDLLNMTSWMMLIMNLYIFAEFAILAFNRREKQYLRVKYISLLTFVIVVTSTFSSCGLLLWGHYHNQTESMLLYRIAGYYIPYCTVGCIVAIILFVQGRKRTKHMVTDWKYGLKFSIPLVIELLSIQVMNQIDKIMIQRMVGNAEAGIYSLATTVSYIIWIIEDSVWGAWLPWMYEKIARNEKEDINHNWTRIMLGFSVITLVTILMTPEIILFLGGAKYHQAIYIVAPLVISTLYRFFSFSFEAMENYHKKTKVVAVVTFVAMIINVVLNYFGIKYFGYIAAAYATAISYLILLIIQANVVQIVVGESAVSFKNTFICSLVLFAASVAVVNIYEFSWWIRYIILIVFGSISLYVCRDLVKLILDRFLKRKKV